MTVQLRNLMMLLSGAIAPYVFQYSLTDVRSFEIA